MYSTSVDLGAAGRDPLFGFGRVNAAAAVQAAASTVVLVDTQAPSVAINAPLGSSSVSGLVAVDASASDNVGVAGSNCRSTALRSAADTAAPFGFSWDSTGVANGMANLVAVAYDAAGNRGQSATVAVNVANAVPPIVVDTTPPVVKINNPVAGAVSGNVSVNVSATDNSGAAGISQTLYIDGKLTAKGTRRHPVVQLEYPQVSCRHATPCRRFPRMRRAIPAALPSASRHGKPRAGPVAATKAPARELFSLRRADQGV